MNTDNANEEIATESKAEINEVPSWKIEKNFSASIELNVIHDDSLTNRRITLIPKHDLIKTARRFLGIKPKHRRCCCNKNYCNCPSLNYCKHECFHRSLTSPTKRINISGVKQKYKPDKGFELLRSKLMILHDIDIDDKVIRQPVISIPRMFRGLRKYRDVGTTCPDIIGSLYRTYTPKFKQNIPDLRFTEQAHRIRIFSKLLHVKDYETNYISFWMLEVLTSAIRRCQYELVTLKNQNALIIWFTYIWKALQFTNSSRREIFDDLDQMLIKTGHFMRKIHTDSIPSPQFIKNLAGDVLSLNTEQLLFMKEIFDDKSLSNENKVKREGEIEETATEEAQEWNSLEQFNEDLEVFEEKLVEEYNCGEYTINMTLLPDCLYQSTLDSCKKNMKSDFEADDYILKDLLVIIQQLYIIFGDKSIHNLISYLCRYTVQSKIYNPFKNYRHCTLEDEKNKKPSSEIVQHLKDANRKKFKMRTEEAQVDTKETVKKQNQHQEFNILKFDDKFGVFAARDYYYNKQNLAAINKFVLPFQKVPNETFFKEYIPLSFDTELITSGDPAIINKYFKRNRRVINICKEKREFR